MDNRMRLLAVERMLSETPITANQIIEKLELEYNIICGRKAIYSDMSILSFFYPNLCSVRGQGYYLKKEGI